MERVYRPLPEYNENEIESILKSGKEEDLLLLSLSVGMYHTNWKRAQDICIKLLHHEKEAVRANAALGLAYVARTKGELEKHLVKPLLLKELRESTEYRWRIVDAIQDINMFLNWNLAAKSLEE